MWPSNLSRAPVIRAQNALVNELENPENRYFGKWDLNYDIPDASMYRSPVWAYLVFS
jgi:hypothetical protein